MGNPFCDPCPDHEFCASSGGSVPCEWVMTIHSGALDFVLGGDDDQR